MDKHYGQTVEMVVRKKGYSISEVARLAHVNRRSVYNWFNQKYLKTEIIYSLGIILKHDFSVEFPDLFTKNDFQQIHNPKEAEPDDLIFGEITTNHVWKNRYIELLEQYHKLILSHPKFSSFLESKNSDIDDDKR